MNPVKKITLKLIAAFCVVAAVTVSTLPAAAQITDTGPFTFSGTNAARYVTNLTTVQGAQFQLTYNSANSFGWQIKSPTSGTLTSNAIYAVRFGVRKGEYMPSSELYITNALNSTNYGMLSYPAHAKWVTLYSISQPPNTNTTTHRLTFFQN